MRRQKDPIQDQPWDQAEGPPRVLIEDRDGATSWAQANVLRRAGFRVAVCQGPSPKNSVQCTLVRDGECDLAEQADVVLSNIRSLDGGTEVLAALRARLPEPRVVRECAYEERQRDAGALEGVTVVPFPATSTSLVEAVHAALGPPS